MKLREKRSRLHALMHVGLSTLDVDLPLCIFGIPTFEKTFSITKYLETSSAFRPKKETV
jgi:hypothetical protein